MAGLKDPKYAMSGPMGGAILKTAVVHEVVRALTHRGQEPQVYFWRTSTGVEVNLVVDTGTALVPIEVKQSATPNRNIVRGIATFRRVMGARMVKGYVVHPGDVILPLRPDAVACPFAAL